MAGETILIVEDNPQNLKLARVLLSSEGYDARTAIDAEQALILLEQIEPKLILMDIQLPGMNGLELTRQLKAKPETKQIVIIAVTAFALVQSEQKAREAGCDGYIIKPIDVTTLPQELAGYLGAQASAG